MVWHVVGGRCIVGCWLFGGSFMKRAIFMVAAVAAAGVWMGQGVPVDLNNPMAAQRLVADLGSADAKVHARAEAELRALPDGSREDLRRITAAARGEGKRTLEERLEEMDGLAALNPTLVNLDVRNETLEQVAGELTDKLKISMGVGGGRSGMFTVHAREVPVREVVARMAEQGAVELVVTGDSDVALLPAAEAGATEVVEGVAIRGNAVRSGRGNGLRWELTVAPDPRAVIAGTPTLTFERVADERGREWKIEPRTLKPAPMAAGGSTTLTLPWTTSAELAGAGDAKTLTMRGRVAMTAVEYDRRELGEIGEKDKTQRVERYAVTTHEVRTVAVPEAGRRAAGMPVEAVNVVLNVEPVERRGAVEERTIAGKPAELRVEITGAKGIRITETAVPMDGEAHRVEVPLGPAAERPLRAVVKYPVREAAVTLPFEFKEVAVGR